MMIFSITPVVASMSKSLVGLLLIIGSLTIAYLMLELIALGKIFIKAGEGGWKVLIPIYNSYILYKIAWRGIWFWIEVLVSFAGMILLFLGGAITLLCDLLLIPQMYRITPEFSESLAGTVLATAGFVCMLFSVIISVYATHRLSKSFGHGVGFTFGLLFFSSIFYPILGFGHSEYQELCDYDDYDDEYDDEYEDRRMHNRGYPSQPRNGNYETGYNNRSRYGDGYDDRQYGNGSRNGSYGNGYRDEYGSYPDGRYPDGRYGSNDRGGYDEYANRANARGNDYRGGYATGAVTNREMDSRAASDSYREGNPSYQDYPERNTYRDERSNNGRGSGSDAYRGSNEYRNSNQNATGNNERYSRGEYRDEYQDNSPAPERRQPAQYNPQPESSRQHQRSYERNPQQENQDGRTNARNENVRQDRNQNSNDGGYRDDGYARGGNGASQGGRPSQGRNQRQRYENSGNDANTRNERRYPNDDQNRQYPDTDYGDDGYDSGNAYYGR